MVINPGRPPTPATAPASAATLRNETANLSRFLTRDVAAASLGASRAAAAFAGECPSLGVAGLRTAYITDRDSPSSSATVPRSPLSVDVVSHPTESRPSPIAKDEDPIKVALALALALALVAAVVAFARVVRSPAPAPAGE